MADCLGEAAAPVSNIAVAAGHTISGQRGFAGRGNPVVRGLPIVQPVAPIQAGLGRSTRYCEVRWWGASRPPELLARRNRQRLGRGGSRGVHF